MKTLYTDTDVWIGISYDKNLNIFLLHTKVHSWSLSKYKKYLSLIGNILFELSKENIKEVYSFVLGKKEQKFNELFGFLPCGEGMMKDNSKFTIMRLMGV